MQPMHDIDVIILMATTLASKRRPAGLVELVAAADLLQGFVPYADKLGDAVRRLSALGLISAAADGFTLTAAGHELMARQSRRAATEELIRTVAQSLAGYRPQTESVALVLTEAELDAAIRAHKATRKAPGKNLLMPKPKVDRHFKIEGRWRRAPAKR